MAVGKDGVPYVAYADASEGGGNKATVMGYVNTPPPPAKEWHYVGGYAGISDKYAGSENLTIAPDGTPYLTFKGDHGHGEKSSVMVYNKNLNQWQYVGQPEFSDGTGFDQSLAIASDGTLYFAFDSDHAHGSKVSVMTYNKNTNQWQYVGQSGISDGYAGILSLAIAADGTLYLAFIDYAHGDKASVMTYNKDTNQWQYVGQPGFGGDVMYNSLVVSSNGDLYIAIEDDSFHGMSASVMTYNKSTNQWQYVGQRGISNARAISGVLKIAPDGTLYLTFVDYKETPTPMMTTMVMIYNKNVNQWQYFWQRRGDENVFLSSVTIAQDGTPYLGLLDTYQEKKVSVMIYNKAIQQWQYYVNKSTWSAGFTDLNFTVAPDGIFYIAFRDTDHGSKASVMAYY